MNLIFRKENDLNRSKCKNKSNISCKYIWGVESKKNDAKRAQLALTPEGNQLSVVYTKVKQE